MAEGEANSDSEQFVSQAMRSDWIAPPGHARRRDILFQESSKRRSEWRVAFGGKNLACACGASALRDDFQKLDG